MSGENKETQERRHFAQMHISAELLLRAEPGGAANGDCSCGGWRPKFVTNRSAASPTRAWR
jgi:hypothetical protein